LTVGRHARIDNRPRITLTPGRTRADRLTNGGHVTGVPAAPN